MWKMGTHAAPRDVKDEIHWNDIPEQQQQLDNNDGGALSDWHEKRNATTANLKKRNGDDNGEGTYQGRRAPWGKKWMKNKEKPAPTGG